MPTKKLAKGNRYPSFQFWATADNKKEDANKQIVIGALTSLEWLRTKFSEFDIPQEIVEPNWEKYDEINLDKLKSVQMKLDPYMVDIICLPKKKIWALRLIEPDLSENDEGVICSVPGRRFQTDVSFAVVNKTLQCGIKITISEPETAKEPYTAFPPSLVKELSQNEKLSLSCGYPVNCGTMVLDSAEKIKKLRDYLKANNNFPAVILCDYEKKEKQVILPLSGKKKDIIPDFPKRSSSQSIVPPSLINSNQQATLQDFQESSDNEIAYEASDLIKKYAVTAHFFRCSKKMFQELKRTLKVEAKSGDIIILETEICGREKTIFALTNNPSENIEKVGHFLKGYSNGKLYQFGEVSFYDEAFLKHLESQRHENLDTSEHVKSLENEITQLKQMKMELEKEKRTESERHNMDLQQEKEKANEQISKYKKEAETNQKTAELWQSRYKELSDYCQSIPRRPGEPKDIPQWIKDEKRFKGKLIFHDRAQRLISGVKPHEVDMQLLCDAIEFLANEYRDELIGNITEEEMNEICSNKYDRKFKVTPISDNTVEYAPTEYKIKYNIGYKGKPVETPLDLHLKVGNNPGQHIRIYFLFDKEKKLIVVGSLPHHLETQSYK